MFCGKCGSKLEDGAKFCTRSVMHLRLIRMSFRPRCRKCPALLPLPPRILQSDGTFFTMAMPGDAEYGMEYDISDSRQALDDIFVEPDEALIAKIGNGFFINLLFRKPQKCSMMLTDKRLYLKGAFYSSGSKKILRTTKERILDLKDITGAGLIYIVSAE